MASTARVLGLPKLLGIMIGYFTAAYSRNSTQPGLEAFQDWMEAGDTLMACAFVNKTWFFGAIRHLWRITRCPSMVNMYVIFARIVPECRQLCAGFVREIQEETE
jgi:hypothetical protein